MTPLGAGEISLEADCHYNQVSIVLSGIAMIVLSPQWIGQNKLLSCHPFHSQKTSNCNETGLHDPQDEIRYWQRLNLTPPNDTNGATSISLFWGPNTMKTKQTANEKFLSHERTKIKVKFLVFLRRKMSTHVHGVE